MLRPFVGSKSVLYGVSPKTIIQVEMVFGITDDTASSIDVIQTVQSMLNPASLILIS